jgi:hypothetical protein
MHYRMLGIDLDGTLLDSQGQISDANYHALLHAQRAGIMVVPCTGRGWREARLALDGRVELELGVFVTGAAVMEIASGKSVDFSVLEPNLAAEIVALLQDEREAVLVYREANLAGHDYLVTGRGELTTNTRLWFELTESLVHFQQHVQPQDLHHTLRVGMVAPGSRIPHLRKKINDRFADRVLVQSFEAMTNPDGEGQHVLEIFAAGVDKWRGLSWIAQQRDIPAAHVATIGDQINDVSMLTEAGCGIAMANAVPQAKACARYVTGPNDDDGVAYAIEQLLAGQWG